MRKTLTLAALTAGGALAMSGTAAANTGDIEDVSTEGALTGSGQSVTVEGAITCSATLEYGLIVQVAQDADNAGPTGPSLIEDPDGDGDTEEPPVSAQNHEEDPRAVVNTDEIFPAEGVGAFGPNRDGATNAEVRCAQNERTFDVVVERNQGSQPFEAGSVGVFVLAGTTADEGQRGPGPFIGDMSLYYAVSTFATGGGAG